MRTKHELPLTLGHEISGHVIDTGADALWYTDRAVIVPAVIPCGHCDACQRGKATICPNQKMPGNDIQAASPPTSSCRRTGCASSTSTDWRSAGIELADLSVIADAVTTPYQAVVQAGVTPGDLVVVNGVGGVGGYAAQIAAAMGGTVVAMDVNDEKLAAMKGQGASLTLNARADDAARHQDGDRRLSPRNAALRQTEWIIFECSGTRVGQETAFSLLNHGATLASSASPWTRSRCGCPI